MGTLELVSKRLAGQAEMISRKHGPAIMTACGIGTLIGTTILAGKAALKAQEPVKELKLKIQEANELAEDDKQGRKQAKVEIGKQAVEIAKIFAPPVIAGSLSIFCFVASHEMSRRKQAALAAAYVAVQESYIAYRERVREAVGEEQELDLYRGPRIVENAADSELPLEIDRSSRMPSPYSRFFDESSTAWTKTPEWNRMFVEAQQQWANDRLHAYGFIFLNEVYEALGLTRTQAGQIVGWKLGPGGGDNFVDFGIYDIADENNRAFVNGAEGVILLDFNVDGPIVI